MHGTFVHKEMSHITFDRPLHFNEEQNSERSVGVSLYLTGQQCAGASD